MTRVYLACALAVVTLAACHGSADNAGDTPATGPAPSTAVASVVMRFAAVDLAVGDTITLGAAPRTVAGTPTAARSMTWSSSAPDIATVTQNALVTAVAPGSASIIANADGHSGATMVTVKVKSGR